MPGFMNEIRVEKLFITKDHQIDNVCSDNNGNTDVIVVLGDGSKYTAAFFTYAFIEKMRNTNKLTGDFLGGKYYWAKNMVLVEDCTEEIINPVVKDIMDEGEFNDVFKKL
jgi:hypothetical protein